MISYLVDNRCWLLIIIIVKCHLLHINGAWPISNSSSIQLLCLIQDKIDTLNPTALSTHTSAMFKSAISLSQKYNLKINGEYIDGEIARTGGTSIGALGSSCSVLSNCNIVGIVGPPLSREASIVAQYGESIGIPVISYSATDPDLSSRYIYRNFYRTVPSDEYAALSLVHLFHRFNWTSCIFMYQNDQFGSGSLKTINNEFNKNNLTIDKKIIFDLSTLNIQGDLQEQLISSSTRVVILWAETIYTTRILKYALDANTLGPRFTWILSSAISFESFNETSYSNLIGLLSIESIAANIINEAINTTLLNEAYDIWQQYEPETFPGSMNVDYYARFAFDATWALILSLEKNCFESTNDSTLCIRPMTTSSFCYDRRFPENNSLLNILDTVEFLGVSGSIKFSRNTTDRIDGIFYLIKNVQPLINGPTFVPILKWSLIDNWKEYSEDNIIVWPGNSLKVPVSYVGLFGVTLRICLIESSPFTMLSYSEDNKTKLIGSIPDFVDYLKKKMNFIPEIKLLPINQTYYQSVQDVANGICDMFVGDVTITAKRREIVDFSTAIFDNSLSIVIRKINDDSIDLFAYLKPFSAGLWLVVLAAIIYAGILFYIIEGQDNAALKNRSAISSLFMSLWYAASTIVGYGADIQVETAAGRILTLGLYALSIILVATYTANLASLLTTLRQKDFISGLDDIKRKKIPLNRIGIDPGSSMEEFFLREVSDGLPNYYPVTSIEDIANNLINNNIDAAIWDTPVLEYMTNQLYCNLTIVGPPFSTSAYGIAIPKEWMYKKDLDIGILSLRESGILNDLRLKWFSQVMCTQLDSSYTLNGNLSIVTMSGLLVTFAVISGLALVLFAWSKRFRIKDFLSSLLHKKHSKSEQIDEEYIPDEIIIMKM